MSDAMMRGHPRVIFTGAPGAGKTVLLRALELDGFAVVEEAATDVIALEQAKGVDAPWLTGDFIDKVLTLQTLRANRVAAHPGPVLFDRSPYCTLALARYLGVTPPDALLEELNRIEEQAIYDRSVVFVGSLGFITATPARRIGLEEAARFAALHREVYEAHGYRLIDLPAAPVEARVGKVCDALGLDPPGGA
jgi:predicted ATPase